LPGRGRLSKLWLMKLEPLQGKPVRMPPGHVAVKLSEEYLNAYKGLYAHYGTVLEGLPVLRERDFDGRTVKLKAKELAALNAAFARLEATKPTGVEGVFEAQERSKNRLFKRLQYLS
jgi:hypothetical protein